MKFDPSPIEDRVEERVEEVEERLDEIPSGRTMPDKEDMLIGSAKKLSLGFVFIDINGFTEYCEENDEEDILMMLNIFIPEIMEIARHYDGTFEKNTGDGILVYFGSEDGDVEACQTVLLYLQTVKYALKYHINPKLEERNIVPISISAGASYGVAHISRVGVHSLNRRTAIGNSANIASKLEDIAEEDQFLISDSIYYFAHEKGGYHEDVCFEDQGVYGLNSPGELYIWQLDEKENDLYRYHDFICSPPSPSQVSD
ncbi:adenylate/guanylate cyclase domain-containing protein [Halostagnicola kamekurae]|uniref:Adenylate cyclase, class 3 n=1 Tax=Halostagnicola kamekurae TaxID=619731 RepID=A0A1I6TTZ2_9EURY|nr:adenylate/guanylate cyclase domain-containing protein [Halostagnicola kamekurae]SFS92624.1 Adenylate cyclase, class 3 [Halostagnicola kamekurae]